MSSPTHCQTQSTWSLPTVKPGQVKAVATFTSIEDRTGRKIYNVVHLIFKIVLRIFTHCWKKLLHVQHSVMPAFGKRQTSLYRRVWFIQCNQIACNIVKFNNCVDLKKHNLCYSSLFVPVQGFFSDIVSAYQDYPSLTKLHTTAGQEEGSP